MEEFEIEELVDDSILKDFLTTLDIHTVDDEVFVLAIFARSKYSKGREIKNKLICRRILHDVRFKRVKSIVIGMYAEALCRDYPLSCLACYFDIHALSTIRGAIKFEGFVNDKLYQCMKDPDSKSDMSVIYHRLVAKLMKSKSRTPYILVDIDEPGAKSSLRCVVETVGYENIVWISETRGGYHVIAHATKETGKLIYVDVSDKCKGIVELNKDMTPLPGTMQGGNRVIRGRCDEII